MKYLYINICIMLYKNVIHNKCEQINISVIIYDI